MGGFLTFLHIPKEQRAAIQNLAIADPFMAIEALADQTKDRLLFAKSDTVDVRVEGGRIYIGPEPKNEFNAARISPGVGILNLDYIKSVEGILVVADRAMVLAAITPSDAPAHK